MSVLKTAYGLNFPKPFFFKAPCWSFWRPRGSSATEGELAVQWYFTGIVSWDELFFAGLKIKSVFLYERWWFSQLLATFLWKKFKIKFLLASIKHFLLWKSFLKLFSGSLFRVAWLKKLFRKPHVSHKNYSDIQLWHVHWRKSAWMPEKKIWNGKPLPVLAPFLFLKVSLPRLTKIICLADPLLYKILVCNDTDGYNRPTLPCPLIYFLALHLAHKIQILWWGTLTPHHGIYSCIAPA